MKVGDLIKLQEGTCNHWELPTGIALLVAKIPPTQSLERGWKVLVDGRHIDFGHQIEQSSEVISENR